MAELVDAADSKSASSNRVPVQVRMEAPFYLGRFFNLFLFDFIYFMNYNILAFGVNI